MAVWSTTSVIEITENRRIDSEFFHPEYIATENFVNRFQNLEALGKLGKFKIGPFGSAFHVSNYDPNSKYRYVRGKDVKPFSLLDDDNVYMPEKEYNRLVKYALQKDDLLISVVGTLGNVAIVPEGIEGVFSCKSTVFRESKVDPYYLLAYFNSKYGKLCLLRRQRGAIQAGLNKEDLKTVPVPLVDEQEQVYIGDKIKQSLYLAEQSKTLYTQATQLLEDALGLNNIEFKKEKSYTASFSEVVSNNRADADYYQTKYRQLAGHLESINNVRLGSICTITKGFEVGSAAYTESGPLFIRVSNLSREGFVQGNSDKYISQSLYNSLKSYQPNTSDILLTKDGTIGTCYVVDQPVEGIISSGILNLTVTNHTIPKEYLALVINSKACSMQASRDCSGALILHWKPEEIRKLRIPVLSEQLMKELADLAYNSKVARKESLELLEQAKKEVETLIEQAAQAV